MIKKMKPKRAPRKRAVKSTAIATAAAPKAKSAAFAVALRSILGGQSIGTWASNHAAEAEHCTGWTWIATHGIAKQAMQATIAAYQDDGAENPQARSLRRERMKMLRNMPGVARMKSLGVEGQSEDPLPDDHRFSRILKRPNPQQSGGIFNYSRVMQLQLTGTCLVWNVPNRLGLPVERYVIPTGLTYWVPRGENAPNGGLRVSVQSARWGDSQGFVEMRGLLQAVNYVIPMEQIQVVRWPHAVYLDDGQSPVAAGALWIDTADMLDAARASQLKRGPDPSLYIPMPEGWDGDQLDLERISANFNAKYAGPDNAGKAMFGTGGKPELLTTTPKDMHYVEAFPQIRDAVMALHGTPPAAVGIVSPTGREGLYAPLLQFIVLTVQPILDLLADEDTEQLAPVFGEGLSVEYEAVGIDDPSLLESELATDITAGSRTVDEVRELRGLPKFGGERGDAIAGALHVAAAASMGQPAGSKPLVDVGPAIGRPNQTGQPAKPAQPQPAGGSTPANIVAEQGTTLNGAQITAAVDLLTNVTSGNTAPLVAIELLIALGIDPEKARRMVETAKNQPKPDEPDEGGNGNGGDNGNGNGNGNGKPSFLRSGRNGHSLPADRFNALKWAVRGALESADTSREVRALLHEAMNGNGQT